MSGPSLRSPLLSSPRDPRVDTAWLADVLERRAVLPAGGRVRHPTQGVRNRRRGADRPLPSQPERRRRL